MHQVCISLHQVFIILHIVCILSESFCCSQAPNAKVADPIPGMIVAVNMYLQAYHMYRAANLNNPEVKRLDTKSSDALVTLQKEFPFGVRRADGTLRLYWCTEKPHSMVHWASTYRTVGRIRTISANVTESHGNAAFDRSARVSLPSTSWVCHALIEVSPAVVLHTVFCVTSLRKTKPAGVFLQAARQTSWPCVNPGGHLVCRL